MRRPVLFLLLTLLFAAGARADTAATLQAMHSDWMVPRAAELVADGDRLIGSLQAYCAAPAADADAALVRARQAWVAALVSWERLSIVAIGPTLEQRMQRKIDFTPTRPHLILKAVQSAPASAADMELVGTPAKGFPALEWLLWTRPVRPASPDCRYAVQVAAEIGREARALETGYRQATSRVPDPAAADVALSELVNQWVGGLERLRWSGMEMPVRVATTAGAKVSPDFPRAASGAAATAWAAQWEALCTLAAGEGPATLAALLRQRGQAPVADDLVKSIRQADAAMNGLGTADRDRVLVAARELAALKRLVENEVAPALGVHIGFSDADGD